VRKGRGFTLIELLVVIAIIAILAAILFPVFARARATARDAKCVAHGRQLGQAAIMYMDDFGGRFPTEISQAQLNTMGFPNYGPYDWPYDTEGPKMWGCGLSQYRLVQLKPYVKNQAIWICPNPTPPYCSRYAFGYQCSWLPRNSDDFVNGDRGFQDAKGVGLTLPQVLMNDALGQTKCGARRMTASKKIMFMCYAFGAEGRNIIDPGNWSPKTWPSYPHKGGSTFVYADGHAQIKKMGRGWAPIGYTNLPIDRDPGYVNE